MTTCGLLQRLFVTTHNLLRIQHDQRQHKTDWSQLVFWSWVSQWAVWPVWHSVNMKLWEALSWLPHPIRDSWVPCHQLLVFLSPSTTTMGSLSTSSSSSYYICLSGFTLYYTHTASVLLYNISFFCDLMPYFQIHRRGRNWEIKSEAWLPLW